MYKMPMNFQKPDDFIKHLQGHFADLYRPMLGAVFTVATIPAEHVPELLTGRVVFFDAESYAVRPSAEYPSMTLAEERIVPLEGALQRLHSLLTSQAQIDGRPVGTRLLNVGGDRQVSSFSERHTGWPEWVFTATWRHDGSRPSVPGGPVVAFGLPPHMGGERAVAEWVFGLPSGTSSPGARHQNELIIVIPDTRGRIVTAEWKVGVTFTLDINCPPEEVELQILFHESRQRRDVSVRAPNGTVELDVPKDTLAVWAALVHQSNSLLGEVSLSQVHRVFDEEPEVLPVEQQARRDIATGETDEVEFKPFIVPRDKKESELIETVVAFANTRGGRIYLGIDDNRRYEGRAGFVGAFPPRKDTDPNLELVNWAKKLIGDKVKPVPRFAVDLLELDGEPVGCIAVEVGNRRPYATNNNLIFIRKGSSNVQPDPLTELRALLESSQPSQARLGGALWPGPGIGDDVG